MKSSKFILTGIKCKKVEGIMTDPKRLEAAQKRIAEATREKFEEYRKVRQRALEVAATRFLD